MKIYFNNINFNEIMLAPKNAIETNQDIDFSKLNIPKLLQSVASPYNSIDNYNAINWDKFTDENGDFNYELCDNKSYTEDRNNYLQEINSTLLEIDKINILEHDDIMKLRRSLGDILHYSDIIEDKDLFNTIKYIYETLTNANKKPLQISDLKTFIKEGFKLNNIKVGDNIDPIKFFMKKLKLILSYTYEKNSELKKGIVKNKDYYDLFKKMNLGSDILKDKNVNDDILKNILSGISELNTNITNWKKEFEENEKLQEKIIELMHSTHDITNNESSLISNQYCPNIIEFSSTSNIKSHLNDILKNFRKTPFLSEGTKVEEQKFYKNLERFYNNLELFTKYKEELDFDYIKNVTLDFFEKNGLKTQEEIEQLKKEPKYDFLQTITEMFGIISLEIKNGIEWEKIEWKKYIEKEKDSIKNKGDYIDNDGKLIVDNFINVFKKGYLPKEDLINSLYISKIDEVTLKDLQTKIGNLLENWVEYLDINVLLFTLYDIIPIIFKDGDFDFKMPEIFQPKYLSGIKIYNCTLKEYKGEINEKNLPEELKTKLIEQFKNFKIEEYKGRENLKCWKTISEKLENGNGDYSITDREKPPLLSVFKNNPTKIVKQVVKEVDNIF